MSRRILCIFNLASILAFGSSFSNSTNASQACVVTNLESKELSEKRARVVKYPDGRELIVIGHNHGDRNYPLELKALLRTMPQDVSNTEFMARVSKLLTEYQRAVQHAREDVQYLRRLLETNQNIRFVGLEATMETTEENYEWIVSLQNEYYSQSWTRGLPQSLDHRNAILLAAGATFYLRMTEPGLFRNRLIVGLESDSAGRIYDAALSEFDTAGDELKDLAKNDPDFLKTISDTYGDLMEIYGYYDPSVHDAKILAAANKNLPERYRDAGMRWIRAGLREMKAMKDRDRAIVNNMNEIGESGVLFIGLWHLESIANMLQQKCNGSTNKASIVQKARRAHQPSSVGTR